MNEAIVAAGGKGPVETSVVVDPSRTQEVPVVVIAVVQGQLLLGLEEDLVPVRGDRSEQDDELAVPVYLARGDPGDCPARVLVDVGG